jgi:hypothetical protein
MHSLSNSNGYAVIPVDPGTKQPPGKFISGRHYEDFEPGDYTGGAQHIGHVTSQRCNLVVIDIDDVTGFEATALGKILHPILPNVETYRSAATALKTHVYIHPPSGGAWPVQGPAGAYDVKSAGFVRAEPAYTPTGNPVLRPGAESWAAIVAAIEADKAGARVTRGERSGMANGTSAGDWTDDACQITGDDQLTATIAGMVAAGLDDAAIDARLDVILHPLAEPWTAAQIQAKIDSARGKGFDRHARERELYETMRETLPAAPAAGRSSDNPGLSAKRRRRSTAADTAIRRVEWLWEPYVPVGMITVLGGMEGTGKTQIAFDQVARETRAGRAVVILSPEDPRSQVTVPRLIAAGADLRLCCFYDAEPGDTDITLAADLGDLGDYVIETGARLVVIDPIVSVLDGGTDGDSYQDVSRELGRLATWAADRAVTVIAITHLRKASDGEALNKMMGSRAFTSKPRSVLMTFDHPDGDGYVMAHAKSNVGVQGPTWGYSIEGATVDMEAKSTAVRMGAETMDTSRVRWLTPLEMFTASSLMAAAKPARETQAQRAEKVIRGLLDSRGGAACYDDVLAALGAAGIGEAAFKTGRAMAGVEGHQVIGRSHLWAWHYKTMGPAEVAAVFDIQLAPESRATPATLASLNQEPG